MLQFGPFELDPDREELRRSGTLVHLARQPLRILLLLIRRAGEVVSREEIHAAVWGDETFVDFEHGINSAIRQIRFALGDHAEQPRYIRTLHRRGYSFIAAVEQIALVEAEQASNSEQIIVEASPPSPRPRRFTMPMFITAIVVAFLTASPRAIRDKPSTSLGGARTIAVRPFQRIGTAIAGVDERTFAEELRATIATLPSAQVSLLEGDARADYVINGTVRQTEEGVRVIVSIGEIASKRQIWSETFQRPVQRRDGLAVEIAHRVMRELAQRFVRPPRREPPLLTKASPRAIALYRRARLLHSRSQVYDWMRTKALYEAVVHDEPRFAEAWSGLSDVWVAHALQGPVAECDRAAAQAVSCARRALALQPGNAEARSALGLLAGQRDYDLATAEDEMRRATAADPEYVDARVNLAMVLAMRGQSDDSLREFTTAQQLDPAGLDLNPLEPLLYLYARRYEDARARYRDILAVDSDSIRATWGLMFTYVAQKNWTEALALAGTISPEATKNAAATEEGFMRAYSRLDEYVQEARRQEKVNDYFLAIYYAQTRNRDRAFEALNRAIDAHTPAVSYIVVDPRLDNLRGDARFRTTIARINLGRPPQSAN